MSSKGIFRLSCEKNIKEIVIPFGLTEIGFNAFPECTSLTTISIPNSINVNHRGRDFTYYSNSKC